MGLLGALAFLHALAVPVGLDHLRGHGQYGLFDGCAGPVEVFPDLRRVGVEFLLSVFLDGLGGLLSPLGPLHFKAGLGELAFEMGDTFGLLGRRSLLTGRFDAGGQRALQCREGLFGGGLQPLPFALDRKSVV